MRVLFFRAHFHRIHDSAQMQTKNTIIKTLQKLKKKDYNGGGNFAAAARRAQALHGGALR